MGVEISWLTALSWIIMTITQYCYVKVLDVSLTPRFHFRFNLITLAAVLSALLSTLGLYLPAHFRFMMCLLVYYSSAIVFFRGKISKKLLIPSIWIIVLLCAESISIYIAPVFGWTVENVTPWSQLIFDATCTVVIWIFYYVIRNAIRIIDDRIDKRLWLRLALAAIAHFSSAFIIGINLFTRMGLLRNSWLAENILLLSGIGIFMPAIALLGLFSMIHKLNGSIRESEEAHFMEAQARSELHRNQAMIAKDQQYRQLRHDIKNHLLVIDALGQKGELDRQHEYLSSLNAAFAQTEEAQFCGHPLIDILLEAKSVRMQKAGIEVKWNLRPVENDLHISDMDLCSLIGNVIDNAIEACERNAAELKPWMSISLQSDGSGLVFQVVNACPNPEAVIAEMEKRSRKRREGAGVGLKAVRRIADSYNGELLIRPGADKTSMEVSAYLPGK